MNIPPLLNVPTPKTCTCKVPADLAPTGHCKCRKYQLDGLDKTAGILLNLHTGEARFFVSSIVCKRYLYQLDDPSMSTCKVAWSSSGYLPAPPKGMSYIFFDQFRRLLSGAKDVTKDDFPMRLELLAARKLADSSYAEQRQKFMQRKAVQVPKKSKEVVRCGQKKTAPRSPAWTTADEEYRPHNQIAITRRRSASMHGGSFNPEARRGVDPALLAQYPREAHRKRPSYDESDAGEESTPERTPKRRRAASMSTASAKICITPGPQKRDTTSPDFQFIPRPSSADFTSTPAAVSQAPGPHARRNSFVSDQIPLPQRLRERLTRIGYYTTKQLEESGLRMTIGDMEALAKLVNGSRNIETRKRGGLDCVEHLAVELRLKEKMENQNKCQ